MSDKTGKEPQDMVSDEPESNAELVKEIQMYIEDFEDIYFFAGPIPLVTLRANELLERSHSALTTAAEPLDTVSISRGAAEYAAACMEGEEMRIRELSRALLDDNIPESLSVRFNYRNEIMKALQQQEQSE